MSFAFFLAEKHPHFYNEAAIRRILAPHSPLSQFSDNYSGSNGSGDVLISISYLLCYLGREGGACLLLLTLMENEEGEIKFHRYDLILLLC